MSKNKIFSINVMKTKLELVKNINILYITYEESWLSFNSICNMTDIKNVKWSIYEIAKYYTASSRMPAPILHFSSYACHIDIVQKRFLCTFCYFILFFISITYLLHIVWSVSYFYWESFWNWIVILEAFIKYEQPHKLLFYKLVQAETSPSHEI